MNCNPDYYACYPTPTTPPAEVITTHVPTVTDVLATTGGEPYTTVALIAIGALVLGLWFSLKGRED